MRTTVRLSATNSTVSRGTQGLSFLLKLSSSFTICSTRSHEYNLHITGRS